MVPTNSPIDLRRSPFDSWLLTRYGFESGAALGPIPPMFLTPDGTFSVVAYDHWIAVRQREYDRNRER